jgi:phage repressor protein C with HTH and peptisase S24 domain
MTLLDLAEIRLALASRIEAEGLRPFARKAGLPLGVVRAFMDGRDVAGSSLATVCEKLGFEFYVGRPRSPAIGSGEEFALLPRYSVSASAGTGLVALEEQEIERIAFRRDWLHEMGIDAREAGLVTASGDSMDPTIPDGAMMLVVRRHGEPIRSGFIYVLVLDGEVLVKRIMRNVDGTFDLISDNPLYPVQKVRQVDLDGLHIAGRVFWVGRRI